MEKAGLAPDRAAKVGPNTGAEGASVGPPESPDPVAYLKKGNRALANGEGDKTTMTGAKGKEASQEAEEDRAPTKEAPPGATKVSTVAMVMSLC